MTEALKFLALARPAGKHPECMVEVIARRDPHGRPICWTMTRAEALDLLRELQSAEAAFQAGAAMASSPSGEPLSPDPSPARGEGREAAP